MKRNRKIALLSLGIALYAVLSAFVIIPIVNRIKLDLGYVVFGLYLNKFGIAAAPVGVIGCIIGNMLKGGSFPIAWAIAQLFIALTLGFLLPKTKKLYMKFLYGIVMTFIGIALIKTVLEVALFQLPLYAKFLSNSVAFIADVIPLLIGIVLSDKVRIHQ